MKIRNLLSMFLTFAGMVSIQAQNIAEPLVIQEQGSFMAGGKVIEHHGKFSYADPWNPAGQTAHVDHAYVQFQIPAKSKKPRLLMLHGGGQSGKTWETTPDGREGFNNIFLRKGYPVYIVDQPRRGRAGSPGDTVTVGPLFFDQALFALFRLGDWPKPFEGSQCPTDSATYHQIMKWATPDTGTQDDEVNSDALAEVLNKIGASVLMTHSRGGRPGWMTAFKSDSIKAIVALEPGGNDLIFPETDMPEPIHTSFRELVPQAVSLETFKKLTKMPIVIYFGDFLADSPVEHIGMDQWRGEMEMSKKFCAVINKYGGNAQVVHLPEIGIKGNTHFLMSDLNNKQIADIIEQWLNSHGL